MNALSKLLVKVSKRVLTHNPTNEVLLQTADRVVLWRNADYITDAQVDEIAAAMPEEPAPEAVESDEAGAEGEDGAEGAGEQTAPEKPLEDMTKAELLEHAEAQGVPVPSGATKAEIIELLQGAEQA